MLSFSTISRICYHRVLFSSSNLAIIFVPFTKCNKKHGSDYQVLKICKILSFVRAKEIKNKYISKKLKNSIISILWYRLLMFIVIVIFIICIISHTVSSSLFGLLSKYSVFFSFYTSSVILYLIVIPFTVFSSFFCDF